MKKTTKKISAAALSLIMGATAFTGCSGSTNSTPGGTDSAASTSGGAATGSPVSYTHLTLPTIA